VRSAAATDPVEREVRRRGSPPGSCVAAAHARSLLVATSTDQIADGIAPDGRGHRSASTGHGETHRLRRRDFGGGSAGQDRVVRGLTEVPVTSVGGGAGVSPATDVTAGGTPAPPGGAGLAYRVTASDPV